MSAPGLGLAGTLPEHGLIAIVWIATGLAGLFVAARTAVRVRQTEKLHKDDYWIFAAFLILVVNAILQTLQAPHCYNLARLVVGLSTLTLEESVASGNLSQYQSKRFRKYLLTVRLEDLRYEFTIIGLFWTVLWLVKGSFLAFFYNLFDNLQNYRRIWWGVVVFTFLSYCGCWILSINVCHPASNYFIFGACNKDIDKKTSTMSVMYSTAVDVLTDLMIMALPLRLLWNLRISASEKKGLAGIFSIGILIIIFAIARAIQIAFTSTTDSVLLALWGIIESSIAVITTYGTYHGERYAANKSRTTSIPLRSVQSTGNHQVHVGCESTENILHSSPESGKTGILVRQDVHQTST